MYGWEIAWLPLTSQGPQRARNIIAQNSWQAWIRGLPYPDLVPLSWLLQFWNWSLRVILICMMFTQISNQGINEVSGHTRGSRQVSIHIQRTPNSLLRKQEDTRRSFQTHKGLIRWRFLLLLNVFEMCSLKATNTHEVKTYLKWNTVYWKLNVLNPVLICFIISMNTNLAKQMFHTFSC